MRLRVCRRFKTIEESTLRLNNAVHGYIESMRRSLDATSELVAAINAHARMTTLHSPASPQNAVSPAFATLLSTVMASRQRILVPLEATFKSGIVERLGDVLQRLPDLRTLLQQRETAITDADAYARKVRDRVAVAWHTDGRRRLGVPFVSCMHLCASVMSARAPL